MFYHIIFYNRENKPIHKILEVVKIIQEYVMYTAIYVYKTIKYIEYTVHYT